MPRNKMQRIVCFAVLVAALASLACSQAVAGEPQNCKNYFALSPLTPADVSRLVTPLPSAPSPFAGPDLSRLRQWDFPSKVVAWHERPTAEEMTRLQQSAVKQLSKGGASASPAPYQLQPPPAKEWNALENWFEKDGPKRLPGMCVDEEKAGYVLTVGVVSPPPSSSAFATASARSEYSQSVTPQDSSFGPNAGTVTPGGENHPADQLAGLSGSTSLPGAYTCAYLYRSTSRGGPPQPTPELYYCHSGSGMPKSVITTMLKFLDKQGTP